MNFRLILLHRYKFSREEETTQQLFHTVITSQSQYSSFRSREITAYPWITLANPHSRSRKLGRNLIENRNKYLGHETQINIYVGISYNHNTTRNDDSWWMCVAHRDVNA